MDKLYEPKNNVYASKDGKGNVKRVIGSEENVVVMKGMARVSPIKGLNTLTIQEGVKVLGSLRVEDN